MNRMELLKELLDEANNRVFIYSKNYSMSKPKDGYEKEWKLAKEKADILQQMYETDACVIPGQTVWRIADDPENGIKELTVSNVDYHKNTAVIYAHPSRYIWTKNDVGKILFLTEADAEAAAEKIRLSMI